MMDGPDTELYYITLIGLYFNISVCYMKLGYFHEAWICLDDTEKLFFAHFEKLNGIIIYR